MYETASIETFKTKIENVDTDKALEAISAARRIAQTDEILKLHEIQKYYEGYRAGLGVAEDIFHSACFAKEDT